jgi:hypothetical protein
MVEIVSYPAMVFVAVENSVPVGILTFTNQGEIRDVLVDNARRKDGMAKTMTDACVKFARTNMPPDTVIFSCVSEDNTEYFNYIDNRDDMGKVRRSMMYSIRLKDIVSRGE